MMAEKEKAIRLIQVDIEKNRIVMDTMPNLEEKGGDENKTMTKPPLVKNEVNQNSNKRILELKNQGYKETEIAKILNIGQGEVRLVLNLYE
jgi:DNA invertase Pin-like site-specific DNA recombinase